MIKKIVKELYAVSAKKTIVILLLDVFLGLNQGVSFMMLLPVFDYLQYGETRHNIFLLHWFESLGLNVNIYLILALFLVLSLIYALLRYIRGKFELELVADTVYRLKKHVFKSVLLMNWLRFKQLDHSKYANDLLSDINFLGYGLLNFLKLIGNGVLFVTYLVVCLLTSVEVTLISSVCFFSLFLLQRYFNRKTLLLSDRLYQTNQRLYRVVSEFLSSFKQMKISGWETYFYNIFIAEINEGREESIASTHNRLMLNLLYQIGGVLIFCVIVVLGMQYMSLSFSGLLLLVVVASRLLPNVSGLALAYQQCLSAIPVYVGVKEKISELVVSEHEAEAIPFQIDKPLKSIHLNKVQFTYNDNEKPFYWDGISFKANCINGIVGSSGVGKTTLLDMLMGLISPKSGSIYINDTFELTDMYLYEWKRKIAYVPQEIFLLNTTVRNNIAMHLLTDRVDEFISGYEVFDFIKQLPQGLDTIVGESGVNLSGGEKQRIALARAMYSQPEILVLDEVTSALDEKNTLAIIGFLNELKQNVTIILSTHDEKVIQALDEKISLV